MSLELKISKKLISDIEEKNEEQLTWIVELETELRNRDSQVTAAPDEEEKHEPEDATPDDVTPEE